ncbi:hypothetical protein RR46_14470, partial [Papilio xuthus]
QGAGAVSRSASFSKARASLRHSSARLLRRLVARHSEHLPDVDVTNPDSMKRARSLCELSKAGSTQRPAMR